MSIRTRNFLKTLVLLTFLWFIHNAKGGLCNGGGGNPPPSDPTVDSLFGEMDAMKNCQTGGLFDVQKEFDKGKSRNYCTYTRLMCSLPDSLKLSNSIETFTVYSPIDTIHDSLFIYLSNHRSIVGQGTHSKEFYMCGVRNILYNAIQPSGETLSSKPGGVTYPLTGKKMSSVAIDRLWFLAESTEEYMNLSDVINECSMHEIGEALDLAHCTNSSCAMRANANFYSPIHDFCFPCCSLFCNNNP